MINTWLENLGTLIASNFWVGIGIAFVAGLLTFFTPCSLSTVPMVVGYIGGTGATKKKALFYSLLIALGQTIIFIILGVVGALVGQLLNVGGFLGQLFFVVLGVLMIFMACEMVGLTSVLIKRFDPTVKTSKKGALGAVVVGMTGAVFATPCATPVLSAMLAYVGVAGAGLVQSIVLMIFYSIGFSVFVVVAGVSFGFLKQLSESEKFEKATVVIKYVLGAVIFLLGLYLIINTLYL